MPDLRVPRTRCPQRFFVSLASPSAAMEARSASAMILSANPFSAGFFVDLVINGIRVDARPHRRGGEIGADRFLHENADEQPHAVRFHNSGTAGTTTF